MIRNFPRRDFVTVRRREIELTFVLDIVCTNVHVDNFLLFADGRHFCRADAELVLESALVKSVNAERVSSLMDVNEFVHVSNVLRHHEKELKVVGHGPNWLPALIVSSWCHHHFHTLLHQWGGLVS